MFVSRSGFFYFPDFMSAFTSFKEDILMFNIGDKVVYPMHGAGIIEAIEEKEILGDKKKYYVMNIAVGDMKVMIPMDNVQKVGLRDVIEKERWISCLRYWQAMMRLRMPTGTAVTVLIWIRLKVGIFLK